MREKATGSLLADTAAQYLAYFDAKEGKRQEAYDLLLSIKDHLADESSCLLHELAVEQKNYPLVAELSTRCYQMAPSQKVALSNARAFAYLKKRNPQADGFKQRGNTGALPWNRSCRKKSSVN